MRCDPAGRRTRVNQSIGVRVLESCCLLKARHCVGRLKVNI